MYNSKRENLQKITFRFTVSFVNTNVKNTIKSVQHVNST